MKRHPMRVGACAGRPFLTIRKHSVPLGEPFWSVDDDKGFHLFASETEARAYAQEQLGWGWKEDEHAA